MRKLPNERENPNTCLAALKKNHFAENRNAPDTVIHKIRAVARIFLFHLLPSSHTKNYHHHVQSQRRPGSSQTTARTFRRRAIKAQSISRRRSSDKDRQGLFVPRWFGDPFGFDRL
jgi:hypothetical protein